MTIKYTILLTIMILFSNLDAQNSEYYKLIDTGKVWYQVNIGEFDQILVDSLKPFFSEAHYANDTTYIPFGPVSNTFFIILREDTIEKKLYSRNFFDQNTPSGPEQLIYDFSMQIGDSIYFSYLTNTCSGNGWYIVDSVKLELFQHINRNVYYLNNHYPNAPSTIWIEGIGSIAGLTYFNSYPLIWDCGELTCCYQYNDILYESVEGAIWGCSFENVDIGEMKTDNNINIYPNPAKDFFILDFDTYKFDSKHIVLQISDMMGSIVYLQILSCNDNPIKIVTDLWPKGMYTVSLISGSKLKGNRKLAVE